MNFICNCLDELWRLLPHCLSMYRANRPQMSTLFQSVKFHEVWERWIRKNFHPSFLSICDAYGKICCSFFIFAKNSRVPLPPLISILIMTLYHLLHMQFYLSGHFIMLCKDYPSVLLMLHYDLGFTYSSKNRYEWAWRGFWWLPSTSCMLSVFLRLIWRKVAWQWPQMC